MSEVTARRCLCARQHVRKIANRLQRIRRPHPGQAFGHDRCRSHRYAAAGALKGEVCDALGVQREIEAHFVAAQRIGAHDAPPGSIEHAIIARVLDVLHDEIVVQEFMLRAAGRSASGVCAGCGRGDRPAKSDTPRLRKFLPGIARPWRGRARALPGSAECARGLPRCVRRRG